MSFTQFCFCLQCKEGKGRKIQNTTVGKSVLYSTDKYEVSNLANTKEVKSVLLHCSFIESLSKRADVMSILPGNKAPWFSSIGFQENKFMDISINDYAGKWLVLFFYPLDFGYVSPSELLELELRRPELESLNCR